MRATGRAALTLGLMSLLALLGATTGAGAEPTVDGLAFKTAAPAVEVAEVEPAAPLTWSDLVPESTAPQSLVRVVRMEVTAYCPCTACCGPDAHGVTASGKPVSYNGGKFVAGDTSVLPFGTKLVIPGYDAGAVEVVDRGGAIKGHRLDVYFPTHQAALEWGRQTLDILVIE